MSGEPDTFKAIQNAGVSEYGPEADLGKAHCFYVNFCRVMDTAEEVIIDFAHQTGPTHDSNSPLLAHQRITLGQLTAKRLLEAIEMTIEHHEKTFGNVETMFEKRLVRPTS